MKKILAVSAEPRLHHVLDRNLSAYGFITEQLSDAGKLPETLASYQPDILIIDFILDDFNGGSICHQLKCDANTSNIPVILLSEYDGLERFSHKFGSNAMVKKSELFPALTEEILNLSMAVSH